MGERQEKCSRGELLKFAITGPFGRIIAGVSSVSAKDDNLQPHMQV